MPAETTEHSGESSLADAPAIARADAAVDRNAELRPTDPPSTLPLANQRFTWRRKLLIGVLGAVVIAAAVFGIPWIRQTLNTVSTDDAFVNGHVTFVAPVSADRLPAFWSMTTTECARAIFSSNLTRSRFRTLSP